MLCLPFRILHKPRIGKIDLYFNLMGIIRWLSTGGANLLQRNLVGSFEPVSLVSGGLPAWRLHFSFFRQFIPHQFHLAFGSSTGWLEQASPTIKD